MKKHLAAMTIAVLASVSLGACVVSDTIDNKFDCDSLCDRYADCYDASYDVDACQSRCEARGDDETSADRIELCTDCLDTKTCTESFECASECEQLIP